ncbi:MAG: membrane protein insertase YidC [Acidobacteriota bacterium]
MEKRAFLAILISFVIIYLFQAYFFPKPAPQTPAQAPAEKAAARPPEKTTAPAEPQAAHEPAAPPEMPPADREFKVRVESRLFKAIFTNRGARLLSFRLKAFKDHEGKPLELVCSPAAEKDLLPFAVDAGEAALTKEINTAIFSADAESIDLQRGGSGRFTMAVRLKQGGWISKTFEFYPYSYEIKVAVASSPALQHLALVLGPGLGNPSPAQAKSSRISRGRAVYLRDGSIERGKDKQTGPVGSVNWLGIEDTYFMMLGRFGRPVDGAITAPIEQLPSAQAALVKGLPREPFLLYVGPKDYTLLKQLGGGLDRLVDYGWFGFVAKPLLVALQFLYNYVHNYGVAIILLTIAIKIVLFPLTYHSSVSMLKMQKLQPEMTAIRERYAKKKGIEDRQKMNAEVMKLYKEKGINPMGGCFPMLLQIPVLIAFYNLLSVSIELRNAPFIWWLQDLSSHDPYYITPILMGVTQIIYQRMTPAPADPVQAKMMMIMPVVFIVMFINIQSGLVLYWTVNNVLSILQQWAMGRLGIVPTRAPAKK